MVTRTRTPARRQAETSPEPHHDVALRLNLLLHTLREIEQHEEDLCCLLHEIGRVGRITRSVEHELASLLDAPPFRTFAKDLAAVRNALYSGTPAVTPSRKQASTRPPAKPRKTPVRRPVKVSVKPSRIPKRTRKRQSR